MLARQVFDVIGAPAVLVLSGGGQISTRAVLDPVELSSETWPGGVSEMARCHLLSEDASSLQAGDSVEIGGVAWRVQRLESSDGEVLTVTLARKFRPDQR